MTLLRPKRVVARTAAERIQLGPHDPMPLNLTLRHRVRPCKERASIVVREFVGPDLRAVKHAQDANGITVDQVGRDIRRARNDKLPRASDAPGPTALRKVEQAPHGVGDLFVDMNGGAGAFGFDVAEYVVAIGPREARPDELQRLRSAALRSAAERLCAKCASTSESSRSGRGPARHYRALSRNHLLTTTP